MRMPVDQKLLREVASELHEKGVCRGKVIVVNVVRCGGHEHVERDLAPCPICADKAFLSEIGIEPTEIESVNSQVVPTVPSGATLN